MASLHAVNSSRRQTDAQHSTTIQQQHSNSSMPTSHHHLKSNKNQQQQNGHRSQTHIGQLEKNRHDQGNVSSKRIEITSNPPTLSQAKNTSFNHVTQQSTSSNTNHDHRQHYPSDTPSNRSNGRLSDTSDDSSNYLITPNDTSRMVNLIHQLVILRKKFAKLGEECKDKLRINGAASDVTIGKMCNSLKSLIFASPTLQIITILI